MSMEQGNGPLYARHNYPDANSTSLDREIFTAAAQAYYLDAMDYRDRGYLRAVISDETHSIDTGVLSTILARSNAATEKKLYQIGITQQEYHDVIAAYILGHNGFIKHTADKSWHFINDKPQLPRTLDIFGDGHDFTSERKKLHMDIVRESLSQARPSDTPTFTFLAGNMGAGKSVLTQGGCIDTSNCVMIDPDYLRMRLLENSLYRYDPNDQLLINASRIELATVMDTIFAQAYKSHISIYCESSFRKMTDWWRWVFQALPDSGYDSRLMYVVRSPADCLRRMVSLRDRVAPLHELTEGVSGGMNFYNVVMDMQERGVPYNATIVDFSENVWKHAGVKCRTGEDVRHLLTEKLIEVPYSNIAVMSLDDDIPVEDDYA